MENADNYVRRQLEQLTATWTKRFNQIKRSFEEIRSDIQRLESELSVLKGRLARKGRNG